MDKVNPEDKSTPSPPEQDLEEDFIVLDSLNEEEIDFCSPNFNPSLALKSENIVVPSPDIMTFKSLSSYEDAVKRRQSSATKERDKKDARPCRSSNQPTKNKPGLKIDSGVLSSRPKCDKGLKSTNERDSSSSRSNLKPTSDGDKGRGIKEPERGRQSQSAVLKLIKDHRTDDLHQEIRSAEAGGSIP
ncbi:hypothetical protein EGW08_015669, partial [Elysia chlorotica]